MTVRLETHGFSGTEDGEHLLIIGAVHGHERCGEKAIRRIISELHSQQRIIPRGRVTFIPVCNPKAYEQGKRFIDRNLNRAMRPREDTEGIYEYDVMNALCPFLDKADVLLDLHSFSGPGEAFIFVGPERAEEIEYARCLGARFLLNGFADLYSEDTVDADEGVGTTEYFRKSSGIAVTMECGQNDKETTDETAYQAIVNALDYLAYPEKRSKAPERPLIKVVERIINTTGGKLAKDWQNFDVVKKGDVIAISPEGEEIVCPDDGYLVMPDPNPAIGIEWGYLGKQKKTELL